MNSENNFVSVKNIIITLAGIVIGGFGMYTFTHHSAPGSDVQMDGGTTAQLDTVVSTTSTVKTTKVKEGSVTATGVGNYTIQSIPLTSTQPIVAPDFKKALQFSDTVTPEVRAALTARANEAIAALALDQYSFDAWMGLALIKKIAGDLRGAEEIWLYASKAWPKNEVSFNNLGDLYTNYIKDYSKAEANYKQAIVNKADDPAPYRSLFELYTTTSYKPSATAAEDVIKIGIAANPGAYDLEVILARYYVTLGRISDARAAYASAVSIATKAGNGAAAAAIQTELNSIPQQ